MRTIPTIASNSRLIKRHSRMGWIVVRFACGIRQPFGYRRQGGSNCFRAQIRSRGEGVLIYATLAPP